MRIRRARQILKTLADDTRLRILNLLYQQKLNVSELREIIGSTQSNLSKHLSKLRLTGMVSDARSGLNVYYYLRKPEDRAHEELVKSITGGLREIEIFKTDLKKLKEMKKGKQKKRRA